MTNCGMEFFTEDVMRGLVDIRGVICDVATGRLAEVPAATKAGAGQSR